jgi:plasmid stability protein
VKNITVSVPEDVYRHARVRAAEQGRSVSALVADFLRNLSEQDAELERLEALQEQVQARIRGFRAGDRLPRVEVHARALR